MLLAGILVAGFVFYRMLAAEGEGRQVETKVAAVSAPATQATQAAPAAGKQQSSGTVSYTHLTLPTSVIV